MKATLPPNTLVQAIDVDPDVIGRVLRLAKDAEEYGDEEYVVQWPSGQEDLRHRHDLTVWPQPSVFNVRAMADDVGLSYLHGQTDEELVRWFLECLKRRYDEASEISRALPYANQPTLQHIQNLLASVDTAREEVKVARARAEDARLELEARTLRVVSAEDVKIGDVVWGLWAPGQNLLLMDECRLVDRHLPPPPEGARLLIGPDPKLLLGEK